MAHGKVAKFEQNVFLSQT